MFTFTAAVIIATNHQTLNISSGIAEPGFIDSRQLKYTDEPSFKFLLIMNCFVLVYTSLVICLPLDSMIWPSIVGLDIIFTMLLLSCLSASIAIVSLYYKGNAHVDWQPFYNQFGSYCGRMIVALAATSLALLVYVSIFISSLHLILNPLLV